MAIKTIQSSSPAVPLGPKLHLRFGCDYESVRRAARQVRTFLAAEKLTERDIWACELAFVEGCNNAVRHTPVSSADKGIAVEIGFRAGQVEFRIDDHSPGFDLPEHAFLPPAENESGRGLFLMQSLMDQVRYVRTESINCLILNKKLTGI